MNILLLLVGIILIVVVFIILIKIFPSKKDMSEIYQQMYLEQKKTNKTLGDMRNVFFANSRKNYHRKERKNG